MFEEARIFHRDHRLRHTLRNVGERCQEPAFNIVLADDLAVVGIDTADQAGLVFLQRIQRREVLGKVPERPHRTPHSEKGQDSQHEQRDFPPRPEPRRRAKLHKPVTGWHTGGLRRGSGEERHENTIQRHPPKLKSQEASR